MQEGVVGLLDDLDADCLFEHIVGNAPDVIADPLETKDYEITVGFKKKDSSFLSRAPTTRMDCQVIFQNLLRIF